MPRTPARPTPAVTPLRAEPDLRTGILDAARHLIVAKGHRDVSMRDIAGEVGCSVSSLYLYFANRDALIHTLIDEGFQRWYDEQLAIEGAHPGWWERLEQTARGYVRFGLERPEMYDIMYLFHPQSMERLPKELYRRARRSHDHLIEIVRGCVGPAIGEDAARLTATAVWATLHGAVSTMLAERIDVRIGRAEYIDRVVRFVVDAVRVEAKG